MVNTNEVCPNCNEEVLEDRKQKLVCDNCGFQVPCCEGGDCASV